MSSCLGSSPLEIIIVFYLCPSSLHMILVLVDLGYIRTHIMDFETSGAEHLRDFNMDMFSHNDSYLHFLSLRLLLSLSHHLDLFLSLLKKPH